MNRLQHAAEGSDRTALALNLALALTLVSLVDLGLLAWGQAGRDLPPPGPLIGAVPGLVVGAVWTVLFCAIAVAKWRINAHLPAPAARRAANGLVFLLLICAAYPIYTGGLRSLEIGLAGNVATFALAAFVLARTLRVEPRSGLAPAAVMAWLGFASLVVVDQARWLW